MLTFDGIQFTQHGFFLVAPLRNMVLMSLLEVDGQTQISAVTCIRWDPWVGEWVYRLTQDIAVEVSPGVFSRGPSALLDGLEVHSGPEWDEFWESTGIARQLVVVALSSYEIQLPHEAVVIAPKRVGQRTHNLPDRLEDLPGVDLLLAKSDLWPRPYPLRGAVWLRV